MKYQVIDRQTRKVMSVHATLLAARRRASRLNLEYGAVRYGVKTMKLNAIAASYKSLSTAYFNHSSL